MVIPSKQFYLAVVLVGRIRDIDVPRVSSVVERLKALEHALEGSEVGGPRGPEVPAVPAKRILRAEINVQKNTAESINDVIVVM